MWGQEDAMDLGHPVNSIAPPLVGRALEVLSGTVRPLSGREIGRIIGEGSPNGVWKALRRLEQQGLVIADHRAGATYYVANREHLAWPAVETLARLRVDLTERLGRELERWEIAPLHASIFGSMARGDADADSDVDLLLIRPEGLEAAQSDAWDAQVGDLQEAVWRWTGNRCQAFVIDPPRLAEHVRANDPLVRAWLEDGVLLAGRPIRRLVEET